MIGKIYGIVYIPENKIVYIGQTIQTGKKRWYEHIRQALKKEKTDKIHTFIKEKGVENFQWEVLFEEDCDKETLNKKEAEYIEEFDTYDNGFNSLKQSNCVNIDRKGCRVLWFDNNKKYINTFNSIVFAAEASGVNSVNVSHCCNHSQTKTTQGWFRFEGDLTPLEDSYRPGISLQVDKLDPFTLEVIQTYPSLQQAEKSENITSGYLSAVCKGKRYSAKNFCYRYHDEKLRQPYIGSRHVVSGVAQVDPLSNIVLNKFLTCEDAANYLKLNKDTISRARHKNTISFGYRWVDAFDYKELLEKGEIFENEQTTNHY